MSEFHNVTVIKKANIYFDGQVTSRTLKFADGTSKTLGVMLPGAYEFNTSEKELMEILSGELTVLLPGQDAWLLVKGGEAFEVPAKTTFKLQVSMITDYCCSFFK